LTHKLELVQWLSTIEDSSLINQSMEVRRGHKTDWWDSISDEDKKSIENGLADAKVGKLNSHSKARELYE